MSEPLRDRYAASINALLGDKTIVLDETEYPKAYPKENYWGRFARMRQAAIDRWLTASIDYVLWIDADVSFPADLFWRLLATTDRPAIVSPLILIEGSDTQYDTAGTRPDFEHRSSSARPAPGVQEMFSVGGCVLVPAEVHRKVAFAAQADDDMTANTEWTSLCVGAREFGFPVLWNTDVVVYHANLPDYGEAFH